MAAIPDRHAVMEEANFLALYGDFMVGGNFCPPLCLDYGFVVMVATDQDFRAVQPLQQALNIDLFVVPGHIAQVVDHIPRTHTDIPPPDQFFIVLLDGTEWTVIVV